MENRVLTGVIAISLLQGNSPEGTGECRPTNSIQRLAGGAEIDAATHVSLLDDWCAAVAAGRVHGVLAAARLVAAGLAEQVRLGVAPAAGSHVRQGILDHLIQVPQVVRADLAQLALGVQARVVKNVLQAAVAQAGDALLGGQEGFQADLGRIHGSCQSLKMRPIEFC